MKHYAFVNWDLVFSTPMKHTYRRGWRTLLSGTASPRPATPRLRRHITFEWDGKDQLIVRLGKLWRSTSQWTTSELKGIVFGLREVEESEPAAGDPRDWLWFIQLTGKSRDTNRGGVLAEFLVSHQHAAPSTTRARVPPRVQELLTWLEHCTGRRPHGPVLVTDKDSRRRILSQVETSR